jgi:central glycolytic genes regulator
LREQGLLETGTTGMTLTESGRRLLEELEPFVKEVFGLSELEEAVRLKFGLRKVVVVPGDSDISEDAKREIGRAGSRVLSQSLSPGDIVAVMGGTTMARMAAQIKVQAPLTDNWFVPARGGLGESVEYQANTIASELAKRTGARYRMLHVPDHLSEEAYQTIMQEPNVREVVDMIRRARIVVHGIGDAITMARRRKLDADTVRELLKDGALAEAFGYYFDKNGAVIHRMATAGLRLEDIEAAETVIGLAGGRSKGEAIAAVLRFGHDDILVTDEAAAEEALKHG